MKILTVDVGTGTQDIFLYDSGLDLENGFKLVLPSPTMMIHNRIRAATRLNAALLLTGKMMGGGPSAWAARDHARAGLPIYATPEAAQTIDDEPEKVERLGIKIIADDEIHRLPSTVTRLELKDFDFPLLAETFARFGVSLNDVAAVGVAVFDHGAAPAGVSDRQFRFDYLDERIRAQNSLTAFAYLANDIPPIMTRLQAVADSAQMLDAPLLVMDTAPAAILGATFDPQVAARPRKLVANIGNFHCLAFRLGESGKVTGGFPGVEGVFEHHTGEIDLPKLETLLLRLAAGTLTHQEVFDDMGHGALVYARTPLELGQPGWDVAVTGPRRSLFQNHSQLRPYFAVPFGDMMLSGNLGLLAAAAKLLPHLTETIQQSLFGRRARAAPWEMEA